jgi:hypothetical protein
MTRSRENADGARLDASFDWQPPTAMPDDDKMYNWNESTTTWDEVTE